jgi:UDP-glucose 4-epimerase
MLAESGHDVIALDNLSVGLPLPKASDNLIPIQADIRDSAAMRAIVAEHRPQSVLHLAAVHHIPTCERKPSLALDVNVMGTQSLLEAIEETDCTGIVMASSGAVYDWKDGSLSEASTPLSAFDVYSTTKLTNEYQLAAWGKRFGKKVRLGRLFNTIGAHDPNGHLIPDIMDQIDGNSDQRCVIKLGNIETRRDYIYVDDAARGFIALLADLSSDSSIDIYNICRGEDYTVADLVKLIGELVGVEIEISVDPSRIRKVDRMQQLGDPSKIAARTGWRAQFGLREALSRILAESKVQTALQGAA